MQCMLDAVAAGIKELNEKNVKLESDNAVLKAEANQLQKHLDQLRNIRDKMNSTISQLKNGFLGFPVRMPFYFCDTHFYLYLLIYWVMFLKYTSLCLILDKLSSFNYYQFYKKIIFPKFPT